jgi:hypothetical protein
VEAGNIFVGACWTRATGEGAIFALNTRVTHVA